MLRPTGREYECDQRHAEIIIEAMGLHGSKPLGTPAADDSHKKYEVDICELPTWSREGEA